MWKQLSPAILQYLLYCQTLTSLRAPLARALALPLALALATLELLGSQTSVEARLGPLSLTPKVVIFIKRRQKSTAYIFYLMSRRVT